MGRVIFQRANLLDGEHPSKPNSTVIVHGERILGVSNGAAFTPQTGDRVIDLAGKTVMPGMFLCHFHATFNNQMGRGGPLGSGYPATYLTLVAMKNVQNALMWGFTGVISGGGAYDIDASLKAAINDGLIQGPRLMASGRELAVTGYYVESTPWWWEMGAEPQVVACNGADEFRKAVRTEIKRGAEIIKIYPTGNDKRHMGLTLDELHAAVGAAHDLGRRVRGHIINKQAMLNCLHAGIDMIDHGDQIDAECMEEITKAGAFFTPTLYFVHRAIEDGKKRRKEGQQTVMLPGGDLDNEIRDFEYMCSILPEAHAAGVKIVTGDDYGTVGIYHGDYPKELEFYVKQVGMPPLQVLRWATKNGAEAMGMGDQLGTVAAGKLADLLVVDGDPSKDITVLQDQGKLLGIMKGGTFVKDELAAPAKR